MLASAGYVIEEIDPPSVSDSTRIIAQICDMEIRSYLPPIRQMIAEEAGIILEHLLIVGDTKPDLSAYMKGIAKRHRIAGEWNRFMETYALVLGPVSTLQPFEVGYDVAGSEQFNQILWSMALTEVCNLIGLPSLAMPVHVSDGLPQGVQLIGPRYHEDLCLDAAEVIEQELGVFTPIEPRDTANSI